MRVNNAKSLGRTTDKSTSSAKRAVLLAVIVVSTTTVNAHSPADRSTDTPSGGPSPAAIRVDQNKEPVGQQGIGNVQSNPFFSIPRRRPNLAARPTKLAIASDRVQPLAALEGAGPDNLAALRVAATVDVTPIDVLGNEASRVIPVADARDEHQMITESQPIFFMLSDGAPVMGREQTAPVPASLEKIESANAECQKVESPDRNTADTEHAEITANEPGSTTGETTACTDDAAPKPSLTSATCPVQLAPMIDLSGALAVPSERSDTEPMTVSTDKPDAMVVTKPGSDRAAASAGDRISPAAQSPIGPPPVVHFNLSDLGTIDEIADASGADATRVEPKGELSGVEFDPGPVQVPEVPKLGESSESQDLIDESDPTVTPKRLSPKLKRTAIAVASLPMPIQRFDADGISKQPTVDTVTHDPSKFTGVLASDKVTDVATDQSTRKKDVSRVAPRVAKSVLGSDAPVARSGLVAGTPL